MPSFSTTLEQSIHGALALANERKHELATLEHLLLALIDEPDAARVMRACSVNLDDLRKDLEGFIEDASFFRLREIGAYYKIPLSSTFIESIRLGLSGRNLFTLTDYKIGRASCRERV